MLELGDAGASAVPGFPGAHPPFGILTHCVAVMEWWGGRMLAGREVSRDRRRELTATGVVADLVEHAAVARRQLASDLEAMEPSAPPAVAADPSWEHLPMGRTQAGVALHIVAELEQHRGEMQVVRDALAAQDRGVSPTGRPRPGTAATGTPPPPGRSASPGRGPRPR